jgi:signal transduction histidine kinase/ligand-binding sensor domain-containing protein
MPGDQISVPPNFRSTGCSAAKISRTPLASWACFSVLLCVLCSPLASAAQYTAHLWTADDGLPQGAFRGIAQSSDGYLWISTLDGLARFDGIRFVLFNRGNSAGIESSQFTALRKGVGDALWLVSEASITRYNHGSFETIYNPRKEYNSAVYGMLGDASGHIWVQLKDRVLQWDESARHFVDITPPNMRVIYHAISWENSAAWGYDSKCLYVFQKGHFQKYPLPEWIPRDGMKAAAADSEGTLWIEMLDGKYISMHDGDFSRHSGNVVIPYKDGQGNTWQIHLGPHLTRFVSYTSSGGDASLQFSLLFEDREGTMWFAMDGRGLYQMKKQLVRTLSTGEGIASTDVYSLLQDRAGGMWIGTWPGLTHSGKGVFTKHTTTTSLGNELVTALFEDNVGNLWIGTHGGVRVITKGKLRTPPPGLSTPEHRVIQAIYQDREGPLWFGTNGGLVSYRDGKSRLYGEKDGLPTRNIYVIMESASGSLWIGGYSCLAKYDKGHFTIWGKHEGFSNTAIWALHEDLDGVMWIGTYDNGLFRLDRDKINRISTQNGLFNNGVFQILEDKRANFWISCHRGIYRVRKQDLNQVAAGKVSTITSVAYGKPDGMLNIECNGGISPAGIKARTGIMWFPTQDGVATIDPDQVSPSPPVPQVVIESVVIDQVQVPATDPVRMAPDQHSLEIDYTAPSFINSNGISFRYKLVGAESTWTDVGTRRRSYFSHLQPGKYTLQVIAANSDGVWNPQARDLTILVLAPFYRTPWFLAALLLLTALLIMLMWKRRLSQLRLAETQQRAFSQQLIASQENERKRIAAEIHDTLGQRLVVINNLALMSLRSKRERPNDKEDLDPMEEITGEARLALEETRQIAHNLRPFQLDRLGLAKAIEALARKASNAGGFQATVEIGDVDKVFPEELRINFYRIVQEALNNIMKHADATGVIIRVVRLPKRVTLTIQDNGRGYTAETRVQLEGQGGFGMTGMAERATLLGGTITTQSELNQGTTVTVEFVLDGKTAE